MDVILLERIEKLGQMGDVVRVRAGYARNYLLPQGKAARATAENRKRFDEQRVQLEAVNLTRRTEAEAVAVRLEGLTVMLIRQAGESGQLYGSVSARDIADAVIAAGFTIVRSQVRLDQPIKTLGLHAVRIALHPEVSVTIQVNVARTADEAAAQLAKAKPGVVDAAAATTPEADEETDVGLEAEEEAALEGEPIS